MANRAWLKTRADQCLGEALLRTRLFAEALAPPPPRSEQGGIRLLVPRRLADGAALGDPLRDGVLVLKVFIGCLGHHHRRREPVFLPPQAALDRPPQDTW